MSLSFHIFHSSFLFIFILKVERVFFFQSYIDVYTINTCYFTYYETYTSAICIQTQRFCFKYIIFNMLQTILYVIIRNKRNVC